MGLRHMRVDIMIAVVLSNGCAFWIDKGVAF